MVAEIFFTIGIPTGKKSGILLCPDNYAQEIYLNWDYLIARNQALYQSGLEMRLKYGIQ
jgi:hypothetical protein